MDILEYKEPIRDEKEFLIFLEALIADWRDMHARENDRPSAPYGPAHGGWEHSELGSYFDAAVAWARAVPAPGSDQNSWSRIAEILKAAKVYE